MNEENRESTLGPMRRWSARRKQEVVLRLLAGEAIDGVSREVGVEIFRLERWRAKALSGMSEALKSRAGDPLEGELDAAKRHIGELSMKVEILQKMVDLRRPLSKRRSRR
jgi:transposase